MILNGLYIDKNSWISEVWVLHRTWENTEALALKFFTEKAGWVNFTHGRVLYIVRKLQVEGLQFYFESTPL